MLIVESLVIYFTQSWVTVFSNFANDIIIRFVLYRCLYDEIKVYVLTFLKI